MDSWNEDTGKLYNLGMHVSRHLSLKYYRKAFVQKMSCRDETFLNRNLYFHYPHYRSSVPHSVMISGSSKVIHFYHRPDIPMLFDLSDDIGEVKNIAKQLPEKHKKLYEEMMRYLEEVGARFPKVNPDYDPEVYKMDRKTKERIQWGPFEGQRTLDDDEI